MADQYDQYNTAIRKHRRRQLLFAALEFLIFGTLVLTWPPLGDDTAVNVLNVSSRCLSLGVIAATIVLFVSRWYVCRVTVHHVLVGLAAAPRDVAFVIYHHPLFSSPQELYALGWVPTSRTPVRDIVFGLADIRSIVSAVYAEQMAETKQLMQDLA